MSNLYLSWFSGVMISFFLLCSESTWAKDNYEYISWEMPVARFSEFGVQPKKIAKLIGDGQIVLNSASTDFTSWDAKNNNLKKYSGQRVAYMASVIRAPADVIRELVWDMGKQDDFSPLLLDAENLKTDGNKRIARFEQLIDVPIIKLKSPFVFQLERLANGDIATVLVAEGDVNSTFQYWEFFELDDSTTLVVLTGWQDVSTASLSYKVLLESEPALGKVFPLLSLYERIKQFKNEAERRSVGDQLTRKNIKHDIRSVNSFVSDKEGLDLLEIKRLNEVGSLMLFQEPKLLSHDGVEANVIQTTALQYFPYEKEKIKPYLSGFENLPEFNEITRFYKTPEETGKEFGHLGIHVKFGPVPVPIHIHVKIEDYSENREVFFTGPESYMYPLFGHIEYMDLANDQKGVVVGLTIGGVVGEKASFVFKMSKHLPFHNVLIAATYTMLTADGAAPWVESQQNAKEKVR